MKKIFTLSLMLVGAFSVNAQLQADPTFNPTDNGGGKHNGVFGGETEVDNSLILPNGKILVGGFYFGMHNTTNQCLSLLNADGSIDAAFNAPGINDDLGDGISAMALQADGKIVLGGYISVYHGQKVNHLIRIKPDGNLDTSFHTGTGFNNSYDATPHFIAIQPDGKIIIGGSFSKYNGIDVNSLIRINEDGSLDESFTFNSDSPAGINEIKILNNSKILIGGSFTIHQDNSYKNLAILNADGSVDKSFNPSNALNINRVTACDIQGNNIVFACDSLVYKVNATDGTPDAGFITGFVKNDFFPDYYTRIHDLKIQPDGKILVAGRFTSYNNTPKTSILRLNTDGTIDNSFSKGRGLGSSSYGGDISNAVESINLFPDGRIFIAGGFLFYDGIWQGTMAVLNIDGSVNTTFNADNGKGADANVNKITIQPDKKILIAGYFSAYNGINRNKIARLNIDGTLDNNFNPGTGPDSSNFLNTVVLQQDGKILAGGNFAHFNNVLKSYIVRLNTNGSIDNTFDFTAFTKTYGDISDGVEAIALQNDGKIIIGFETIQNYITDKDNSSVVLRLNADGSLDNSFNTTAFNSSYYSTIYSIQIQKDGKILVAGDFDVSINGNTKSNLVRLNSDGSLDEAFNAAGSGPAGIVYSANLQPDNKIIISGNFKEYNHDNALYLARLNTDGSLDASYAPVIPDSNIGNNFIDFAVSAIDANNKTVLSYFYYNELPYSRILRYNTDGSIDSEFGTENKADYLISDIAMQDNKLLLGGFIESFNGIKRNRITRITTPEVLPVTWVSVKATLKNANDVEVTWQTADELNVKNYTVQKSINGANFSNLGIVQPGSKGFTYSYTDANAFNAVDKVYYRVLETDKDGKISYSKTVFVTSESGNLSIQLYPNPVQNILHVKNLAANVTKTLSIVNAEGKVISSLQTAAGSCDINAIRLTPGVYYFKISSGTDNFKYKFIKQ